MVCCAAGWDSIEEGGKSAQEEKQPLLPPSRKEECRTTQHVQPTHTAEAETADPSAARPARPAAGGKGPLGLGRTRASSQVPVGVQARGGSGGEGAGGEVAKPKKLGVVKLGAGAQGGEAMPAHTEDW